MTATAVALPAPVVEMIGVRRFFPGPPEVRAIRDVASGGSAFDARSAAAMIRGVNAPVANEETELTTRELEVLRLLARGLSNRVIGEQLFISDTTAKFHVGNILRKLGVSRRAEAVYEASKLGLL